MKNKNFRLTQINKIFCHKLSLTFFHSNQYLFSNYVLKYQKTNQLFTMITQFVIILSYRYEQQFEWITSKKIFMESEKDLSEKKRTLRDLEHQIRCVKNNSQIVRYSSMFAIYAWFVLDPFNFYF